jgi:hypothetical protein
MSMEFKHYVDYAGLRKVDMEMEWESWGTVLACN